MKIYNTLTRKKEELVPIKDGRIGIYACGPTVYDLIHMGNARMICVFDGFRRFLEYIGYKVNFVQNFTDIDDKVIRKAAAEGVSYKDIAARYIDEYFIDADGLNIKRATVHPHATDHIDDIIYIISTLIEKGFAYTTESGDVYFRASSFSEYGKLSHQPLEELEAGARIDVSEKKESPVDFALWKAAKPEEPSWDAPFGKGRPGWHIECSAMSRHYLGDTFDIHCGGQDLIFPHHENEIAQSECCNGVPFARYWMHNGFLNINNTKMSKSLGNFFTTREVAAVYGYEPIRFFMLSAHYRSPLNYSPDLIEQSVSALSRLYTCRDNLDFMIKNASGDGRELAARADMRRTAFVDALSDDYNSADGIAELFELVRDINTAKEQSADSLTYTAKVFDELCSVLGLLNHRDTDAVPSEIIALADARAEARKQRDFARADALRDEIAALGYTLEDTPQGAKITKK